MSEIVYDSKPGPWLNLSTNAQNTYNKIDIVRFELRPGLKKKKKIEN